MAIPLSRARALYPEFLLSVGYSDEFLALKYGELGVMSVFSKNVTKSQTETA